MGAKHGFVDTPIYALFVEGLRDMTLTNTDFRISTFESARPWRSRTDAITEPAGRAAKRVLDLTLAAAALVVGLPVFLVLAALVKLDGGPVFFRQRRVGRDGELFAIVKFRSMAADAEARLAADPELLARYVANDFKLPADEDPRITRVGRLLRSTSLDELPQLWNVIRGEMSLVGPRPIVEDELLEYRVRGAQQAYLSGRPGMTGRWQASGRSLVGYDQRIQMDVAYRRDAGVLTDVAILLLTVVAVARRQGAH